MEFRRATETDVPSITRIYNQGIEDRIATLETEMRTEDERLQWFHDHSDRYPVFVAEECGQVIGWASLNVFNPRPAYCHVADFSVYEGMDLYGKMGFRTVGIYKEQGQLDGRWVDTIVMEKLL